MDKCIIQTGLIICFILCLFHAKAIADVELLNETELKEITGQSGFSVSPFPGFEINIEEDEEGAPCEHQEDCEEKKEEKEGGSLSFQLPQSGLLPSIILPSGSMVLSLTAPIPVNIPATLIPTLQVVNAIPINTMNSMPMSFGGGLF